MKKLMTAILTAGLLGTCMARSLAAEPVYKYGNGENRLWLPGSPGTNPCVWSPMWTIP